MAAHSKLPHRRTPTRRTTRPARPAARLRTWIRSRAIRTGASAGAYVRNSVPDRSTRAAGLHRSRPPNPREPILASGGRTSQRQRRAARRALARRPQHRREPSARHGWRPQTPCCRPAERPSRRTSRARSHPLVRPTAHALGRQAPRRRPQARLCTAPSGGMCGVAWLRHHHVRWGRRGPDAQSTSTGAHPARLTGRRPGRPQR